MESYDYLHALALAGVALYLWRREPIRLLVTPLMLLSFFVLYGVGNIVYFAGADTVPDVRADVTLSLVIMWAGLLLGVEIARAASPGLTRLAESTVRGWSTTSLTNQPEPDRILALTGLLIAGFVFAVFFGFGKPGQVLYFLALDGAREKQKFRLEMSGQGGYLYQVLIASIGPFLSFLLLIKARITRGRLLRVSGLLLCAAVLAGKVGTFQKVPWLVYLLQLLVVSQATRRLRAGFGRLLLLTALVLAGSAAATAIALPDIGMGILEFLAYRFFEVNNEVVYQTFYVYPQHLRIPGA